MATTTTFQIPSNIKHISDYTNELPKNCLFDKGITGCGGTTLAITNNEHYIICVPFVNLIDCKTAQHKGLFAVKANVTIASIKAYIKQAKTIKIMVTYDSLSKVINALGSRVNEVNLLVDELHLLFNQYTFRKQAITYVLSNYTAFKSYCFMTATMIKEKYTLKELKHLPIIRYQWAKVIDTKVNSIRCKNVDAVVNNMIAQHLESKDKANLYFFINSIDFINNVCKTLNLNSDMARMICSKDNTAKKVLPISSITSEPKKINFITSTAFEGCDLLDANGKTIIVSEGNKTHTLVDISTSLVQICGRIRNSKYNDNVFHLYSSTRYTDVSVEENEQRKQQGIKEAYHVIEQFNKLDAYSYGIIKEVDSLYLYKNDGKWEFDENAVLIDMYNFEMCNGIYSFRNRMSDEYIAKGYKVDATEDDRKRIEQTDDAIEKSKAFKFKDFVQTINEEQSKDAPEFNMYLQAIKEQAFIKYPFLKDAINKLGFGKIGTLNYNQTAIKKELINQSKDTVNKKAYQVAKLLHIKSGDFYTNAELKDKLTEIYKTVGINKTAKATDIKEWYEVKESKMTIKVKDKKDKTKFTYKRVNGVSIICPKVVIKQTI